MIKLNKKNLYKLGKEYTNLMLSDVEKRYLKEKMTITLNPFTGFRVIALFENKSGSFNEDLINTLLCKPIIMEKTNYEQINCYVSIGKLVFYSSFSVDKVLKENNVQITKQLREKVRKDYVDKYSNDWLKDYKIKFPNYYKTVSEFEKFIKCIEGDLMILNNEISKIFDYKYLTPKMRHHLICSMEVDVCPYCNRQYITSYLKKGIKRTTADLDHFLPKSLFTLLSLSLFNFIPSCQICNSRFKIAKRSEILYPYEAGFGEDANFTIAINRKSNFDTLTGNNDFFDLNVDVKDDSKNKKQIYNNIEMFKINEVYQIHKQHVRELFYKQTAYKKTYKEMLIELMEKMKLDNEEIDLFLYGYSLDNDDFYKRPLAKLTYDIVGNDK